MSAEKWMVHKFGGTSLGSAERLKNAANIIQQDSHKRAIIVSAMGGTTDMLIDLLQQAQHHNGDYRGAFGQILTRHKETIR